MDIKELYQELIIDHGTNPRHCCQLSDYHATAEGFNPLCGDKINVFIKTENQTIQALSFTGSGCAISTASASLMAECLQGASIDQAIHLSHAFKNALTSNNNNANLTPNQNLGKLEALLGVKTFPARVKCATLAWHTLEAALQKKKSTVTTELLDTEMTPTHVEFDIEVTHTRVELDTEHER